MRFSTLSVDCNALALLSSHPFFHFLHMRHISKFACIVFGAAVLLTGCKGKDGDPGPAGAAGATGTQGPTGTSGQNLTGNLIGYVNPVNENGTLLSKSGVTVSIDGANPAITATTDVDGKYTLANVRNGTYNLTYSRAGLATFRRFGLGHVGGDQPTYLGTLTITQVSTQTVTGFSAVPNTGAGTVMLTFTMSSPTPPSAFRYALYASATSPAGPTNGILLFTGNVFPTTSGMNTLTFSTTVNRITFTNAGFASGTTVNLAAYGSTSLLFSYSDPSTGRFVYPALNTTASPTATIVVP